MYTSMNNSYLVTILTLGTQAWDRRLVQGYRPKHHGHYYSFLCRFLLFSILFSFPFFLTSLVFIVPLSLLPFSNIVQESISFPNLPFSFLNYFVLTVITCLVLLLIILHFYALACSFSRFLFSLVHIPDFSVLS
jgi:hypothetical protein